MSQSFAEMLDELSTTRRQHQERYQLTKLSNPTTGFLTATTFIYALGAGITAAAGTRLALQWFSAVSIRYNPFHALPGNPARNGIFRRCLASYCVSIGQFARLLLTIVMVAVSQAPSPESNPNPPLPVKG